MGPEAKVTMWFKRQVEKRYEGRFDLMKPPQGMYSSRKGISDIILCIDGFFIAVEMKAEGKRPTMIQQQYLDKINKIGGLGLCCIGKDEHVFDRIDMWIKRGEVANGR